VSEVPDGFGSIWKYLQALVRADADSGSVVCGFQTNLDFADVVYLALERMLLEYGGYT